MTKAQQRSVDEALKEFRLIDGAGSEDDKTACAMTLLAWIAGRPWTDRPPCAHPTLCSIVIRGNDAATATAKTRASLVKAGLEGVLDTWWIPSKVLVWAQARPKDVKPLTEHQFAMYVLKRIAKWKANRGLPGALDANLTSANLTSADLTSADLTSAIGEPLGRMPNGWKLNDSGLWVVA